MGTRGVMAGRKTGNQGSLVRLIAISVYRLSEEPTTIVAEFE